ncbi:hypothetical protein JR316_0002817 [Psilocybe cubensis]|uniref:Uncharacterized protein n=1 Tax=Psilocybe cubensis TaxID=181762 RepID=A0ACB8HFI4_PSICU|nr:hypothetical protein JR316_0002817 [Psilocybe cubensis]KAH9485900.1 hypothetical protein JR316_0002817 [Psilocybe cubensis]
MSEYTAPFTDELSSSLLDMTNTAFPTRRQDVLGNGNQHNTQWNFGNSLAPGSQPSVNMALPQGHFNTMSILRRATNSELLAASNEAFYTIFTENMALKAENSAKSERILELKLELTNLRAGQFQQSTTLKTNLNGQQLATASINEQGNGQVIPSRLTVPPEVPDAEEDDYPLARYWDESSWKAFKEKEANANRHVKTTAYLTDEEGDPLDKARLTLISQTLKSCFNELHHYRLDPSTWAKKMPIADDFTNNTMRAKFPEFTLCSNNWKLCLYKTQLYPGWNRWSRSSKHAPLSREKPSFKKRKANISENHDAESKRGRHKKTKNTVAPIEVQVDKEVVEIIDDDDMDSMYVSDHAKRPSVGAKGRASDEGNSSALQTPAPDVAPVDSSSSLLGAITVPHREMFPSATTPQMSPQANNGAMARLAGKLMVQIINLNHSTTFIPFPVGALATDLTDTGASVVHINNPQQMEMQTTFVGPASTKPNSETTRLLAASLSPTVASLSLPPSKSRKTNLL